MQKLVRAGFGNNNVDTCARVCHSPTGYGLGKAFGTSAGTQDFDSVEHTDVVILIGANPTDGHPVFASRLKKRLRAGAKLIVIDPRRIDLVRSAACRGEPSSALAARNQCRRADGAGACDRDRRPVRRSIHPRALRLVGIRGLGRFCRRPGKLAGSDGKPDGRPVRRSFAEPHGSMPVAAMARSTTALVSPSTARARPR